jgi:cell division transport system permease protein
MFKRVLLNTIKNMRRSPYQAIAATIVVAMTFFVTYEFGLVMLGAQKVLTYFETRPQVTAFFTDEVTEANLLGLKQSMEQQAYVSSVNYISKQKALEIYREQNKQDPLLLEMVTADILPASLEVSATSVDKLPQIQSDLLAVKGVEEVVYQQDIVERLTKWTRGLWKAGMIRIVLLTLMSFLVLTIIISLRVSTKRAEITTMRLLGATAWFINGPFVVEGAIYGILGSIIAWGITYILLLYETPMLMSFVGDVGLLPINPLMMLELLVVMSFVALVLGMLSGSISSARFGSKEK